MNWVIWQGDADPIFTEPLTSNTWRGIFAALEIKPTLKDLHIEPGMEHTVIQNEFQQLVAMVHGESGGGGGGGSACQTQMERLCSGARRSGAGNCLVCLGVHQSAMRAAKCTTYDFDVFCEH
eukprot:COSAG05_NODE_6458_length_954_cov_1.674854_2_plen_122_part_00